MKRTYWNILLVGGLYLTLGAPEALARGMGGGGGRGGGGGERGGERGGEERGGAGRGGPGGGGARGTGQGPGGAGREGNTSRSFPGNSSAGGGGYHPGGSGAEGFGKGAYGGGNASAAARNPAFSNANRNRDYSGATGAQGAAAGAAYSNRNNPGATGAQGAAAGAAYANRNNPAVSGAVGAVAGAAAGYHPSSENYGFYHGTYNGNWGAAYGMGAAAAARPLAWGAGAWGAGASMLSSGYLPYSNPYASGDGEGGYNYSQPIPVASSTPSTAAASDPAAGQAPPAGNDAEQQLNPAIDAFKSGDYDSALNLVNQAIQQTPGDGVMHEFRALVLFAEHNYKDAAATIHSVLAVGPGWDWTTLSSLYSDIENYTKQLQALEAFVESHPQDAAAHFLLGYHYMTCGHPDTAAGEFEQVVKLVSTDKVAADLLKMLAPPKPEATQPPEPRSPKPSSKPIDPATLVGTWKAARDDGSKFELALPEDLSFTWKYSQKQKAEEFSGTYSVEGNLLVLQRQDGTSLVGQIAADGQKKFNFKILGGPADDPGLNFSR